MTDITPTEAEISWTVSPPGTGQVEYGLTPGYGQVSKYEPASLDMHIQRLTSLRPGTTYHFRVLSSTDDGLRATGPGMTFTTLSAPPQPESPTGIYGSGVAADSKDNFQLSGSRLSHRFRAGTSSELLSVQVQQRGGPIYSDGSGGRIRVTLRTDDGSPRHRPSDQILAEVTVEPGNPEGEWTTYETWTFAEPAAVTAGDLYHVVFENIAAAPRDDYISINELFTWEAYEPRQPAFGDDYAVLYDEGAGWRLEKRHTANMDLVYANGTHDGQAYTQNMCDRYGVISGSDQMSRQQFTVSVTDRLVTAASVRLKRIGGDEPLVFHLEREDGTAIESVEVPASAIPEAAPGCSEGGATWVTAAFAKSHRLVTGESYVLRLATGRSSLYTVEPIREGSDVGMRSYRFVDGEAQRTIDGGVTWTALYPWSPVDLQFYFLVTQ